MHNGSGIPCFGTQEGDVTSAVSGGTPPYEFRWSTGATTDTLGGVPAGYYSVVVSDAQGNYGHAEITLTEPEELKVATTKSSFPNGTNISCFECNNATIQTVATKGTPPYSYAWGDGPSTNANRYGLGPRTYTVTVTDANGCVETADVVITQPERSDWTMNGNAGTNPATQYIGTSDNKDVVFKSNGQESLRLRSDGAVQATALAFDQGYRLLMADSTGKLKVLTHGNDATMPLAITCDDPRSSFPWMLCGNNVFPSARLGTLNNVPLRLITADAVRMHITTTGKVGIGTTPPSGPVNGFRLFVEDGIVTRDVLVKLGDWPDFVFDADHALLPLAEFRTYLQRNHHLPGIPSACELEEAGGVAVGDMQRALVRTVEEQALYILQLEERLQLLEKRMEAVEVTNR